MPSADPTLVEALIYQCLQILLSPLSEWGIEQSTHVVGIHTYTCCLVCHQLYPDVIEDVVQEAVGKADMDMECHNELCSKHEKLRERTG